MLLCSFIKQYLNASNADEVEHLKAELETVKQEKAQLEKELAELKVRSSPRSLRRDALHHCRSTVLCSMDTLPGMTGNDSVLRASDMDVVLACYHRAERTRRSKLVRRSVQLLLK